MFLKLLEYGNCMRFAKFISKAKAKAKAKTKAKGDAESNQRLVNINECSAKDKDINLEPDNSLVTVS